MVAFREAVRLGAAMIEADIHRTRDGTLVMLHDDTLDRTTDATGPINTRTWEELAMIDAGSWFGSAFAGERIPSLEQLLDLADEVNVGLCLEAKGADAAETRSIAIATARAMATRDTLHRHVLASFDHPALLAARDATTGLVIAPGPAARTRHPGPVGPRAPGRRAGRAHHPAPSRGPHRTRRRRPACGRGRRLGLARQRSCGRVPLPGTGGRWDHGRRRGNAGGRPGQARMSRHVPRPRPSRDHSSDHQEVTG